MAAKAARPAAPADKTRVPAGKARVPAGKARGKARDAGGKAQDTARSAARHGRRAADSPVVGFLGRAGFLARGLLYVIIGWIAVEVAFGQTSDQADKSGALQLLGRSSAGEIALWLLAAGFFGMALWRLTEVIYGPASVGEPEPDQRKAAIHRALAAGKVVIYAVLCYTVVEYALVGRQQSSDTESVDLTAMLLQHPGGQALIALIGAVLAGAGIGIAVQAWRKKFREGMDMRRLQPRARLVIEWLGRVGGIARGAVFVTAGVFLVVAAVKAQPGQAKGVDSALRALAGTPAGPWLLVVVALGLIVFGVFSACEARWRKV